MHASECELVINAYQIQKDVDGCFDEDKLHSETSSVENSEFSSDLE